MVLRRIISQYLAKKRRAKLSKCGNNVVIDKTANLQGCIEVGDNVSIGARNNFVSTMATLKIENNVIFGPDVTIYTGDHPIEILGYHISEIDDTMKRETSKTTGKIYDKDVVIESGCWIGTRAIILKGVTVGKGSVIGAGAVVTKDVPPYSIYVGSPGVKISPRFTPEQIEQHEALLKERLGE